MVHIGKHERLKASLNASPQHLSQVLRDSYVRYVRLRSDLLHGLCSPMKLHTGFA